MTGPPTVEARDGMRTPVQRRRRRERNWLAAAVAITTAIAAIDAASGESATMIGLLIAGPLLAGLVVPVRETVMVAVYALLLAVVLGWPDEIFGEVDHLSRIGTVVIGDAIAVAIALARARGRLARRRYATLAEAGDIVQSTRDPEVMLIQVAGLLARALADWAFVFLREDDGKVRAVAAMHADPQRQRMAWDLLGRYPLDPGRTEGPAAVMRDGRPRLYREIDERLLASIAADDRNLSMLERLAMTSAVVVPLTARGRTFGAIALATAESDIVFDEGDLELAGDLADRVAIALDNARLYENLTTAEAELRRSRDELQAILDGVADAITAQDEGSHLVFANQAAVETMGFESVEELLATPLDQIMQRFEFYDEDGNPFPVENLPGRLALQGDPDPPPALTRYRLRGHPEERWVRVKALPVGDQSGVMAINIMEDVTEEREAAEVQHFLAEASRIMGSSLEFETTLNNVARLAVPRIADWCAVDVLDEDGTLRPVAVQHSDPAKIASAQELRQKYPPDPSRDEGSYRVVRTGQAELYPEFPEELIVDAAVDKEHLRLIRRLGMVSAAVVPLIAHGRTLGVLTLVTSESGRKLDEDDLLLAEELGHRCAIAVDNSRLYRERTHIARTLQESLLPPELPQPPGLDVAARFRAAGEGYDVGGDFYDVFDTGSARWAAVIGDVCGKGPEAAAITALARYTLRATAMTETIPSRILATLNEAMLRQRTDRRFSTVLYACLDRHNGATSLRFASGGHPLPLVLRADGSTEEVGTPGTLLGIVPDPDLFDAEVALGPGDTVVLYTDGVTDAGAPEFVREPRELAALVQADAAESADAIADRLLELALSSGEGIEPRDDIAILVIRVPPA